MGPDQFFKNGKKALGSGGRVDDILSNFIAREGASRIPTVPLGEMFLLHDEKAIVTGGGERSVDASKLSGDHVQAVKQRSLSKPHNRASQAMEVYKSEMLMLRRTS